MNCDRIARWYRWFEYLTFGSALQRRRRQFLNEVSDARRVLVLGDGDGRFTAALLRAAPEVTIDSIEISANMLRMAERRISAADLRSGRVRLLHGDARRITLPGNYDLVVAHFFLDCFTSSEVETLIKHVGQFVTPHVRWLISDFRIPEAGMQRAIARRIISTLYWLFGITTGLKTRRLPDYAAAFRAHHFIRQKRQFGAWGMLVSEIWARSKVASH